MRRMANSGLKPFEHGDFADTIKTYLQNFEAIDDITAL